MNSRRPVGEVLWDGPFEFRGGTARHRIVRVPEPWGCQAERLVDGHWRRDVVSSETEALLIKYAYLDTLDLESERADEEGRDAMRQKGISLKKRIFVGTVGLAKDGPFLSNQTDVSYDKDWLRDLEYYRVRVTVEVLDDE